MKKIYIGILGFLLIQADLMAQGFQKYLDYTSVAFSFNIFQGVATSNNGQVAVGYVSGGGFGSNAPVMAHFDHAGMMTWSMRVNVPQTGALLEAIALPSGGYVTTGFSGSEFMVIKTDDNGNTQWFKTFATPSGPTQSSSGGRKVIEAPNGDLYILGTDVQNTSLQQRIMLAKLNSNGNLQNANALQVTLPGGSVIPQSVTDLIYTSDGNLLILGFTGGSGNLNKIFLMKTDLSFSPIWTNLYEDSINVTGYKVREDSNGNFWVAGRSNYSGNISKALLMKTDNNGAILEKMNFADTIGNTMEALAFALNNDQLYLAGKNKIWQYDPTANAVSWASVWGNNSNEAFYDIDFSPAGDIVGCGIVNVSFVNCPYIIKGSSNGTAPCFGNTFNLSLDASGLSSVSVTPNSVALTLNATTPPTTTSITNALVDQCPPVGISTSSEQAIRLFPNPAQSMIYVHGIHAGELIQLHDATGRLCLQMRAHSDQSPVDLSSLEPGVYTISISGKQELHKLKLVIK
jgi:hypothetical protein